MAGIASTGNDINFDSPGISEAAGRALKLQTDTPHLVSMGGDRLSTSVTLHPIPQGRVTLGSGGGVDIPVQGTGVAPLHCHIENSEGVVTLYPLSENLSIDGVRVAGPTRLSQGVMLTIGRSNYLRFNHPAEAKLMKSVLPNPRISMAPITFEPDPNYQQIKINKKPPAVPKRNSKESLVNESELPPSNIMTKVSKFEFLAAQNLKNSYSPKVFSANEPTVNIAVRDVLGKDIHSLSKHLPQSALNYAELNNMEIQKTKSNHQKILGGHKSSSSSHQQSHYVNVTINETTNNTINNRVVIFENVKEKNINVTNRSQTPILRTDHSNRSSGEFTDMHNTSEHCKKYDAEIKRNQAQRDRIKEQEIERAEQQRLEEILNMCAEYEKQSSQSPQEKNKPVTPNRIITNGSLPRDKRHLGTPPSPNNSYSTPPNSPYFEYQLNNEVTVQQYNKPCNNYENVFFRDSPSCYNNSLEPSTTSRSLECTSPYENVKIQPQNTSYPSSPRTRIKTFVSSSPSNNPTKETADILENQHLLREAEKILLQNLHNSKDFSTEAFIFPDVNVGLGAQNPSDENPMFILPLEDHKTDETKESSQMKHKTEQLRKERKEILSVISRIKRQMSEIDLQEDELQREVELEKALISGEHKSKQLEMEKLENKKQNLIKRAQAIDESMMDCQSRQEHDQNDCKQRLQIAQESMALASTTLHNTDKSSPEYEEMFESYLQAQDQLENEKKTFEDLEFHHLEEEANWLATREEIQREIVDLSQKIESIRLHLSELQQQLEDISRTNANELKTIEKQKFESLVRLEEIRTRLKSIDEVLASVNSDNVESEHEFSSSDSDITSISSSDNKLKHKLTDLSCSVLINKSGIGQDLILSNNFMSQSFSEKMLQEHSVLEDSNIGNKRCPSQDDIDRISKVTSNAPINIDESRQGSLGRKTIESLKEIERNRHLHLCQQGSQVIEQERQRVLALKQRVQEEVLSKWAQEKNKSSLSAEDPSSNDSVSKANLDDLSNIDAQRPLSDASDMSQLEGAAIPQKSVKKEKQQRPLTLYLPVRGGDLDLRQHIESAGHQVVLCPHVLITSTTCRGFLHKRGSKLNGWSRRWFVFDRTKHTLTYYSDKSEKKARGGAYFQAIEEVYLDHLNSVKSPNPEVTFIVKTHERVYYLMAPSPEAMRIWMDVIFTGAEGYREYQHGT